MARFFLHPDLEPYFTELDYADGGRVLAAYEGGKAILEDLGSKNGTLLRGERITSPRPLADGDEILLGRVHMTFRVLPPVSTRTGVGR